MRLGSWSDSPRQARMEACGFYHKQVSAFSRGSGLRGKELALSRDSTPTPPKAPGLHSSCEQPGFSAFQSHRD